MYMIAQYLTCCYTYILYSYMRIPLSRSYRSRRGVRHLSHLLRGAGQGPRRGSSGSVSIHSIMHMSYYITLPYSYSICLSISNTILHEYIYAIYAIYYIRYILYIHSLQEAKQAVPQEIYKYSMVTKKKTSKLYGKYSIVHA